MCIILMDEAARAGFVVNDSMLLHRPATENLVSGHLPAGRDHHDVGIAEEEIAWRGFGSDIKLGWR